MAGNQAWVTLATNDTYAVGALVLGHSLRKVGTARQLAILVTSTVSPAMRNLLTQTYDLVHEVNLMDSKDPAHLALMQRPELGVTFTKIHCWTLTQFTKCVFMDADTLVLKNCDELFQHDELSAVPDVGWPDCFNSGVFVYVPSLRTYNDLVKVASEQGSYDGADQGLLNTYFSDWRTKDITRHLSFVYNMNSNAFYTYLPAFKKFGQDVKIVHFLGERKPWHYNFNLVSNRVDCSDQMHYSEHLQYWWDLFMSNVQPRLSNDCAGLAGDMSRLSIKTAEELKHFPSEQILGSEGRQFAWERGQIDYMGADAFSNIQKKLDAAISASVPLGPAVSMSIPVPPLAVVAEEPTEQQPQPAGPPPPSSVPLVPTTAAAPEPVAAPAVAEPAVAPAVAEPAVAPAVAEPAVAPAPVPVTPAPAAPAPLPAVDPVIEQPAASSLEALLSEEDVGIEEAPHPAGAAVALATVPVETAPPAAAPAAKSAAQPAAVAKQTKKTEPKSK